MFLFGVLFFRTDWRYTLNGKTISWGDVLKVNTPNLVALAAILLTMFSLIDNIQDLRTDLKADIRELRQDIKRIDERLDSFGERIAKNEERINAIEQ